jgi:hypothetical protein
VRLSLGAALVLAGCAPALVAPPGVAELELHLAPAALGRQLQLTQRVTGTWGRDRGSFEVLFEVDAEAVRIAAVALGRTALWLTWDGSTLRQEASRWLPPGITAARILSDVQLAWWPVAVIRDALPPGLALQESPAGERRLLRDDRVLVTVAYEGTPPAWRHVVLRHLGLGYQLDIESVE